MRFHGRTTSGSIIERPNGLIALRIELLEARVRHQRVAPHLGFRRGLVFTAHRLVSLNSRLESNKEEYHPTLDVGVIKKGKAL